MRKFVKDVNTASPAAKVEASRELGVTIIISLAAFFVGPLIFSLLVLPVTNGLAGAFKAFTGADIYIAAVSLLSISIYSISKEYKSNGRDNFGFPHATTILSSAVLIVLLAGSVYTGRVIYEAMEGVLAWRGDVAAVLGWLIFIVASYFAYAVLVLRNDIESGAARRTRQSEAELLARFNAENPGGPA